MLKKIITWGLPRKKIPPCKFRRKKSHLQQLWRKKSDHETICSEKNLTSKIAEKKISLRKVPQKNLTSKIAEKKISYRKVPRNKSHLKNDREKNLILNSTTKKILSWRVPWKNLNSKIYVASIVMWLFLQMRFFSAFRHASRWNFVALFAMRSFSWHFPRWGFFRGTSLWEIWP